MQTRGRVFDDLSQLLTSAAGAAQGVREEVETLVRAQVEQAADRLDLVPREDFEAVRAMAADALERVEALETEIAALKAQKGGKTAAKRAPRAKARAASDKNSSPESKA